MTKRRAIANPLALAVLSYLSAEPQHPYQVSRSLREHGDDRSMKFTHGSLYLVFQQLEKAGFIAERESTREGARPERTVYEITAAGRAELDEWLRDLIEEPRHEFPHFVTALAFIAALRPDDVVVLLRQRLEGLARLRQESADLIEASAAQGVPELFYVEEQYRIAIVDAEASFVEDLIGRIEEPDGFARIWREHYGRSGS